MIEEDETIIIPQEKNKEIDYTKIKELTDQNYNDLITIEEGKENNPIFVDFYSPYCGPCQTLMKFLPNIQKYSIENNKNVSILKCDVSKNPKISEKFQISSIPFTIIIDKDRKVKEPNMGLNDISYYIKLIDKYSHGNQNDNFLKKIIKKIF
jgi:thioredoxin-like negative regulator of GroEL